jgi:hypothetical protein
MAPGEPNTSGNEYCYKMANERSRNVNATYLNLALPNHVPMQAIKEMATPSTAPS